MSDVYKYGEEGIVLTANEEPVPEEKEIPRPKMDPTPKTNGSILDSLREDFVEKEDARRKRYIVPEREGYEVEYTTFVDYDQMQAWLKRSTDQKSFVGINELRFSTTLLANTCRGIYRNGELIQHEGTPVTFTTEQFMDILGTYDAPSTIRKFYGLDGHTISVAKQVLQDAGYGNLGLMEGNPTND